MVPNGGEKTETIVWSILNRYFGRKMLGNNDLRCWAVAKYASNIYSFHEEMT
jgi:hypothetical protein